MKSAAGYSASGLKSKRQIAVELALALFGWLLISPWAILIPRCQQKIAVIGREHGRYLDNAKYFHLHSKAVTANNDLQIVFITEQVDVVAQLADTQLKVLRYPSPRALWFLLRCAVVVVDSNDWQQHLRAALLMRAKSFQLWHGVGFKRIGLDRLQGRSSANNAFIPSLRHRLGRIARIVSGSLHKYSAVNTTSSFYRDKVFRPAFRSQDFPTLGYPRHTFGQLPGPAREHALLNTDRALLQKATQWQAQGRRVVVVAPTYRETRATSIGLTPDAIAMLDLFCAQHRVEFIFKFHPFERQHCNLRAQHLHSYNSHADIYPLLPLSSALVTDYSSIYMDYLLLDKPVLFLVPDLAQYKAQDRQLQFDYAAMTPGPKLQGWPEVTSCLLEQWEHDAFRAEREALRLLAFGQEDPGQATSRILTYMASKHWIPDHPISVSETQ